MKELMKKMPIPYWLCIVLGSALGILLGTRFYWTFLLEGNAESFLWNRYFAAPFVNQLLWGLLTPVVYYFYTKYPVSKSSPGNLWVKAVLASIAVSLFHEIVSYLLWWGPVAIFGDLKLEKKFLNNILVSIPGGFISQMVEYWVLYLIFAGYDYALKFWDKEVELVKIESQLNAAKLSALRLQLQPHFLFNTLNTISSLSEDKPKDAQRIISKLGNMLRGILSKDQQSMIPLWQEIEFVKNYLDIEEVRFQDRLTIDYNLDKSTENGLVPSFILQPLVENAIKHGFSKTITSGIITIQAFKEGDYMVLKVSDNGAGTSLSPKEIEHHGIGLANVRDRLTILFGDKFVMEAIGKSNQGFNVSIKIPFQT